MIKNSLLFGLLLAVAVLASCNQQEIANPSIVSTGTLEKIRTQKKLRVAYIHYPPSAYRDPKTGKITGLFVQMIEEIVRQINPNIQIEYEETTWADFTAALNSGRVDLSIAGTFTTVPRARVVAFTNPVVYLGRSAIVQEGETRFVSSMGPEQFDRPDIKIGVVSGEGSHEYVKANFKNQDNIVVFTGSDLSQALAAVSSGQVDVGLSDALETQKYAKSHSEVMDLYAERPYDLTPIAWAVRQNDMIWLNFLNTALHTLEAQGKVAEWESEYDFRWTHAEYQFKVR